MKINNMLDNSDQSELAKCDMFSRKIYTGMPDYIIAAAEKAGKVYDPITNTFKNKES